MEFDINLYGLDPEVIHKFFRDMLPDHLRGSFSVGDNKIYFVRNYPEGEITKEQRIEINRNKEIDINLINNAFLEFESKYGVRS